ncbi:MAG: hypothetical protein ACK456_16115 [Pseudanabaenaceae cyanobacterium]|jgi:hypothetical protein
MAVTLNDELFEQIQMYLNQRVADGDRLAKNLLQRLPQSGSPVAESHAFSRQLFGAWQQLATQQVGENCWSYPVAFGDLANGLDVDFDLFLRQLAQVQLSTMQLLAGRGQNYPIGNQEVATLTFHSHPFTNSPAAPKVTTKDGSGVFRVGDRVRVTANRPQYANQTGVIEQVISVSCRVKLDNGWSAFLPNHCLEKCS